MTQRSSSRNGLTLTLAKGLFKQIGAPDHKVVPHLNETYVLMHNMSRLDQTNNRHKKGHSVDERQETDTYFKRGIESKLIVLDETSQEQTKDDLFASVVDIASEAEAARAGRNWGQISEKED